MNTRGLDGKSGCRATPSAPRSEKKLTGRLMAVPTILPLTTCCTFPVFFSSTRKSLSPRKAMVVGVVNPLATALTIRLGSTMLGDISAALGADVPGHPRLDAARKMAVSNLERLRFGFLMSPPRCKAHRRNGVSYLKNPNGRVCVKAPRAVNSLARGPLHWPPQGPRAAPAG